MSGNERLASVVALITIGLGISLFINPPFSWLYLILLVVTTCVGTNQVLRAESRSGRREIRLAVFVLPSLIVVGGFLFLRLPASGSGLTTAAELIAVAVFLAVALYCEQLIDSPNQRGALRARHILNLLAYVSAFALFSAIFAPKVRSIMSATAVLLASALIAAELFRDAGRRETHVLYVGVIALCLAQVTWALNYWVLGGLTGGAILLLVFYTVTNVIRSYLNGTLAPRILGEHLAVASLGLVAVIAGGLWLR